MSSALAGLVVHRRDGGLELVRTDRRRGEGAVIRRDALGDRSGVPQAAVLLGERDQRAVGASPRRAAGIGEQHQREQTGDLAVVGQQSMELTGQADRLGAELDASSDGPELAV